MKNKLNHSILMLTAFSVSLLCIRILKTNEFSFIFMIWNLFLGFVPFWISQYLYKQKQLNKSAFYLIGLVWILFLPNAPYMLTDLFHLHSKAYLPIWFDLVLILSFAITGLVLFYHSIYQITKVVKLRCPFLYHPFYLVFLFLAVSYGVYIGRFLRVNSWDVLSPITLAETCIRPLFHTAHLKDVSCFTLVFSVFLSFIYLVINPVLKSNHQ